MDFTWIVYIFVSELIHTCCANLLISILYRISPPRPSHALQVQFEIPSHTFSALKVDQLKVTGEVYKPYKGVRGRSVGDVEWRW